LLKFATDCDTRCDRADAAFPDRRMRPAEGNARSIAACATPDLPYLDAANGNLQRFAQKEARHRGAGLESGG
jgi:hypothetical protein